VLCSRAHYNLSHEEAAERLRPILSLRGLKLPKKRVYLRALDIYGSSPELDTGDALAIAHMEDQGPEEILSYDTDFDDQPGIKRVEP
jgi:predicted nucleic acid-binding protein